MPWVVRQHYAGRHRDLLLQFHDAAGRPTNTIGIHPPEDVKVADAAKVSALKAKGGRRDQRDFG